MNNYKSKKSQISFSRDLFLELYNYSNEEKSLKSILNSIKKIIEVQAIGIRLFKEDDYPFIYQIGFEPEFIKTENRLKNGNKSFINCFCSKVIQREFSHIKSNITETGSFYTNNLSKFMQKISNENNFLEKCLCVYNNFETMALIPIPFTNKNIGLIQVSDRYPNQITEEKIYFLEMVCEILGNKIPKYMDKSSYSNKFFETFILSKCVYCKQVRENKKWITIEEFFEKTSYIKKLLFSHTICPNCFNKIIELEKKI